MLDIDEWVGADTLTLTFLPFFALTWLFNVYGAFSQGCFSDRTGEFRSGRMWKRVAASSAESELYGPFFNDFLGYVSFCFAICVGRDSTHIFWQYLSFYGLSKPLGGAMQGYRNSNVIAVNFHSNMGTAQFARGFHFTSSNLFGPGYSSDNAGDGPLEQCTLCNATVDLNSSKALLQHMNLQHKGVSKIGCLTRNGTQLLNCTICARVCLGQRGLHLHCTRAHSGQGEGTVEVVATGQGIATPGTSLENPAVGSVPPTQQAGGGAATKGG
jgi:hypothetical protein